MAKIAIAAFTYHPQRNGVANVVAAHARYLASIGHEIVVLTGECPGFEEIEIEKNIEVRRFRVQGSFLISNFYRGNISQYLKALNMARADIYIFHCWQIWSTDLPLVLCKGLPGRHVLFSHGAPVQDCTTWRENVRRLLLEPYRRLVMPILLRGLDDVVFLSERQDDNRFYDRKLVSQLKKQPRTHVVPNGVDVAAPQFPEACRAIPSSARVISYVANFDPIKDHELFLRIFASVRSGDDVAVLAGKGTARRIAEVFECARALGVAGSVVHVSSANSGHISWILSRSCAQLFTSKSECFPLAVLEASACGCPTVSRNVGAIADIPGAVVVDRLSDLAGELRRTMDGVGIDVKYRLNLISTMERYEWHNVMNTFCRSLSLEN